MEWISVEDALPKNGEQVLVLVEAHFLSDTDVLCQKRSHRVFQATFSRCVGWETPFAPNLYLVRYWMPKPTDPVSQ